MDGWRGTSGVRKVKSDMMPGSERLSWGQSLVNWQWYCSSRLNVTTLTKLIHTVTQTDSRPSVSPAVDCGGRCHISWPLLSVTSHPCLAPSARHGPAAHECMCVIDGDPRFNRACEKMRQSEETDAVGDVLLSELTSHPRWFNTLLHCPPPTSPPGSLLSPHTVYYIVIPFYLKGLYLL